MRLVVLGASGMLGQEVSRVAREEGLEVVEVSRADPWSFHFPLTGFSSLAESLELAPEDLLVNCIGWIPQKRGLSEERNAQDAYNLNVRLVSEIADLQQKKGFRWLQIATDCIFSGETGGYMEGDSKSPIDLYGKTKAEGEEFLSNAFVVRCSIVGPDKIHGSGLYEWLKGLPQGSEVMGYETHVWNGVSTFAFARLAVGLFHEAVIMPFLQHWVPRDSMTKFQLISEFASLLGRSDVEIHPEQHYPKCDRTLSTLDKTRNARLWSIAGYEGAPTVAEMLSEFISRDIGENHYDVKT